MKKKKPRKKSYTLVRTGKSDSRSLFGNAKYIKVPTSKPFDREHNDLYKSEITVSYKIEADQIRALFGLDRSWKMSAITEQGGFGDHGYPRATIVFCRETGGPKRAMEILAGEKAQAQEGI
jgi:hypothetical protein